MYIYIRPVHILVHIYTIARYNNTNDFPIQMKIGLKINSNTLKSNSKNLEIIYCIKLLMAHST